MPVWLALVPAISSLLDRIIPDPDARAKGQAGPNRSAKCASIAGNATRPASRSKSNRHRPIRGAK